jgi:hypothetical protein
MMRLKAFLEGKADSRQEVHGMITLEDMQARHRALRAQLESLDPAVTGEVPPRERDRARGLLEDGSSDDAAMAPKRAPEKSRVRRLPAEPLERGNTAGIPVTSRRRTDEGAEPAPRRRVVAHEREDALLDDELAEEREDARRGDVATCARSGAACARTAMMRRTSRTPACRGALVQRRGRGVRTGSRCQARHGCACSPSLDSPAPFESRGPATHLAFVAARAFAARSHRISWRSAPGTSEGLYPV